MGSKKKKQESSSSSSNSDGESSDSSTEKRVKRKTKRKNSSEDLKDSPKKTKTKAKKREFSPARSVDEEVKSHKKKEKHSIEEEDREDKQRTRRRSASPAKDRRPREERRPREREDRPRYEDRRRDFNRSHDERYRNRRFNPRDNQNRYRRDDRDNRDNRNRRDDRNQNRDRNYQRRRSRSASYDHANAKWGRDDSKKSEKQEQKEREKPNFGLSGKLTEETNTFKGVVIKYSEPPEARKPKRRWRLYPFKGEKALQTLYIHRESAYLIGRDRKVVDLPVDHPSCSKQHAALQYRLVPFTRDDGSSGKRVRPYIIDLDSANGTYINNKRIEASKYVELLEKDVIKFGYSSREYVLLHENSKDETQDDDVKQEDEPVVKKEENE